MLSLFPLDGAHDSASVALPRPSPTLAPHASDRTEQLGEAIAELAARLHAATYELLVLLRAFDERAGWNNGFLSCAHWLRWRTGIDLGAAREKVRVAKALVSLPLVSAAIQRGAISYAKVRAITRVATSENEAVLLDIALAGTAAHVEQFVRAWRSVDRVEAARDVELRHLRRELSAWVDDDGMVVIRGRLTPEVGAVVSRALETAADRLFREASDAPTGPSLAEEVTVGQRRADALGLVAEAAVAGDLDRGSAGDRYRVVLHVDSSELAGGRPAPRPACEASGPHSSAEGALQIAGEAEPPRVERRRERIEDAEPHPFDGVLEVADGALHVAAETSRRLACDASLVVMAHAANGTVLDVGRKTRTIPPAIRRALLARDRRCTFPGCSARRCDAHHLEHWADGGTTALDNLALLCRRHHRALHEGGFSVARQPNGSLVFVRPDGKRLEAAPALPVWNRARDLDAQDVPTPALARPLDSTSARLTAAGITITAGSVAVWDGAPVDVAWALDVLRGRSGASGNHAP